MLKALAAQLVLAVGLLSLFACNPLSGLVLDDSSWTDEFYIEEGELASTGRNPYFSLDPDLSSYLKELRRHSLSPSSMKPKT